MRMPSNKMLSNPQASTCLIIVMGVAGSGKSTLAHALAKHFGYIYLDGDDFHSVEARELMAKNIPLTDEQRAPWVASLKQRLQSNAANNVHTTLAFSGLKQKHRNELRNAGLRTIFLFLNGDKNTIQTRLDNRQGHFMSPLLLESQFSSLENPTEEIDVHTLDTSPNPELVMSQAISVVNNVLLQA
jgi:gluconokinase